MNERRSIINDDCDIELLATRPIEPKSPTIDARMKELEAANAKLGKSLACAIAIIQNESGGGTDEKSAVLKRWARELIEEVGWTEEDYYDHLR